MARLSWHTRLRVHSRIALTKALKVVPLSWAQAVRNRYSNSDGVQHALLGMAVSVLRHRPLAPLQDFVLGGSPGVRLVAVESRIVRLVYWRGEHAYEGVETDWWKRFCTHATSILEIGANVGYYTVQGALAAPHARYVAVEANPESADVVRRNVDLNALDNVVVVQAAVLGERTAETVELALPDQEQYVAPAGAYLVSGTEGIDRPAHRTITVSTVAMGDLLDDADLIKLDIEGMEYAVLEPALPRILERRATLFVEVLAKTPRLRAILGDMAAAGYCVYAIGRSSLSAVAPDDLATTDLQERYGGRDVIVLPQELAASRLSIVPPPTRRQRAGPPAPGDA